MKKRKVWRLQSQKREKTSIEKKGKRGRYSFPTENRKAISKDRDGVSGSSKKKGALKRRGKRKDG